jgi:hypothetical protein
MRKLAATLGALVLGAGLAAVPAGSAAADPLVIGPKTTLLQIVLGASAEPGPSERKEPIVVQLSCDLVGNTHPYPAEACAEIEAANGDISAIPPQDAACIAVWQPVEISVNGIVEGQVVEWSATESNEACAAISHGHLFDLLDPPAPAA